MKKPVVKTTKKFRGVHLIKNWLITNPMDNSSYCFPFEIIQDNNTITKSESLVNFIAREFLKALYNLDFLKAIAHEAGLHKLANYLSSYFNNQPRFTRMANFGEVITCLIQREVKGYTIPIHKLRFREKDEISMRIKTDVLALKESNEGTIICFISTKTRTSMKDKSVGVKAYKDLEDISSVQIPDIIDFTSRMLFEIGNYEMASKLRGILLAKVKTIRENLIMLIFDDSIWNNEILQKIEDNEPSIEFNTTIVRINGLIELFDDCNDLISNRDFLGGVIK